MRTQETYPVLKGSNTIIRPPMLHVATREPVVAEEPAGKALCVECRYAERYAEQPRVRCRCATSVYAGRVVFAGQPACAGMEPRDEQDLTLAWCSPESTRGHARSVQPQPHSHGPGVGDGGRWVPQRRPRPPHPRSTPAAA